MLSISKQKQGHRQRRAHRTRARISGTDTLPRLSVNRSAKHIYAQLIDDVTGHTLASACDKEVSTTDKKPVEVAKEVGKMLATKTRSLGITHAVFDRGSYRYHGRVAALADGAREGGLIF